MGQTSRTCRICGTTGPHQEFITQEMMFGTRESFEYFQCSNCNCLQISDIPNNLGDYYPSNYYSLTKNSPDKVNWLKKKLLKQRFRNALFDHGYKINKIISNIIQIPDLRIDGALRVSEALRKAKIKNFSARFLDVGCGNCSTWLEDLQTMGFEHLYGVDPFIKSDILSKKIKIIKCELVDLRDRFDFISFHHSLEHIPNQRETLAAARRLLTPDGCILVRIPTVSSLVWRLYGTNWVEMDPPRHLYLHSRESLLRLANDVGLVQIEVICDSLDFEFYGSEQYLRNIPLSSDDSYWINKNSNIFSDFELLRFREMAAAANSNDEGGRACFFLRSNESSV